MKTKNISIKFIIIYNLFATAILMLNFKKYLYVSDFWIQVLILMLFIWNAALLGLIKKIEK
jgi:hypothetical protein